MPDSVPVLDGLEALIQGPDPRRFRVGLAMPLSGLLAVKGPSVFEALLLAGQEINAARRTSDRKLELVLFDSSGPPAMVAGLVNELAASGTIDAFVGAHTSTTLEKIEQTVQNPRPYIFVPQYEGAPRRPGYFCAGETPASLAPGILWLMAERGVKDWAIVGTDYVWPRSVRGPMAETVTSNGGQIVFDRLVPYGAVKASIAKVLDELAVSHAQGVIINMPGRDLIDALRAFRNRGLDGRIIRLATALEENVLYAVDGDHTGNLYAVQHSFSSLQSPRQLDLHARYRSAFGENAPVLTNWAEHAYDGLHLLAALEERGRLHPSELGTGASGPESAVLHPNYLSHLAVAAGLTFEPIVNYPR